MTSAASAVSLVDAARSGTAKAVARLLTLVEEDDRSLRQVLSLLGPPDGATHVVGVTGAPGVGKSTLASALVGAYRASGARVAVLAVDPSSPFSGGALLGDRVRMSEHALDPDVFVRSMASHGHLGGLSATVPLAVRVLAAAGFQIVLIETVGVGQSEIEVAYAADTTVVVLAPGMGDGIQAAKAGILEIGDVFAVNKADLPGVGAAESAVRTMVERRSVSGRKWRAPVLRTVAVRGEGVSDLADRISAHHDWLVESGGLQDTRRRRVEEEVTAIALGMLRARLAGVPADDGVAALAAAVLDGSLDPYAAADRLVAGLTDPTAIDRSVVGPDR